MTTLVAVAFPYESTASAAAEDVRRLALDVPVDPDAMAVVSRDRVGTFQMTTRLGRGGGTQWGVFWVLLCDALFGEHRPGTSAPGDRPDSGVDDMFRRHLREMVTPGTSALFLAVDSIVSEDAVRELTRLGGILVTWGMTADARLLVERALNAMTANEAGGRLWPDDDSPAMPRYAAAAVPESGQTGGSV